MTDPSTSGNPSLQHVSESLRGPLASLGVCLQTLRDHASEEAIPFVRDALGDVERLSRLAGHLLQWSEIRAGTLSPHPSAFSVSSRMAAVLDWHMQQARFEDTPFQVRMEPGEDRAWTDPDLASDLLDALLEHVHASSRERGLEVQVQVGETTCAITLTADYASGRVETFHLARARALSEMLGGHVRLTPSVLAGTRFSAHWPLRLPRETSLYLAA